MLGWLRSDDSEELSACLLPWRNNSKTLVHRTHRKRGLRKGRLSMQDIYWGHAAKHPTLIVRLPKTWTILRDPVLEAIARQPCAGWGRRGFLAFPRKTVPNFQADIPFPVPRHYGEGRMVSSSLPDYFGSDGAGGVRLVWYVESLIKSTHFY